MINTSAAYKTAITAPVRRVRPKVHLEIQSPDLQYTGAGGTPSTYMVSRPAEFYDGVTATADRYATWETNRWILDGTVLPLTINSAGTYTAWKGEVGLIDNTLCSAAGAYGTAQGAWVGLSGVNVLQAVKITWPDADIDGYAVDFSVAIASGGTEYVRQYVTGNTERSVLITGFTVYMPDAIGIDVTKWSIPGRRARFLEIFAGYLLDWDADDIQSMTVTQTAQVSCMNLPYGTANLTFDNSNGLFDPRNKDGIFQSLEERQPIQISLGVDLPTGGGVEYVPLGVYYQHERAWGTTDSNLTMKWDLVDILGLLSTRTYTAPDVLPTSLLGWVKSLTGQLGGGLAGCYHVDSSYANTALTTTSEEVDGKNCGDILRWICQATGTFPRADAETGYLTVEPMWDQGRDLTLDNMDSQPSLAANDTIGSIIFQLGTGDQQENLIVTGNESVSATNVTVANPFLTTNAQALVAARHILITYGGNRIIATGRGDPSSEVGDVSTVELKDGSGASARLVSQTLNYQNGILASCRSELIQPDGVLLYKHCEIITTSGTWTAPSGVTQLYVILVGGGQGGGHGASGNTSYSLFDIPDNGWAVGQWGADGTDGSGGKVWYGTININEQQNFSVSIGAGGVAPTSNTQQTPTDGGNTTFGGYSSANGHVYTPSFTDIDSTNAYGRSGAATPTENRGDGGKGGRGGYPGGDHWHTEAGGHTTCIDHEDPGPGNRGQSGTAGCVVVYYNKQ